MNLKKLNDETNQRLESWKSKLTDKAYMIIGDTDYNSLYDLFGQCESAEDVNKLVDELFEDEV